MGSLTIELSLTRAPIGLVEPRRRQAVSLTESSLPLGGTWSPHRLFRPHG